MNQAKPKGNRRVVAAGVVEMTPEDLQPWQCGHYGNRRKDGKLCGARVAAGTHHCVRHAGRPKSEHVAMGLLRIDYAKFTLDGHDGSDIVPHQEILRLISFWKAKCNLYGQMQAEASQAARRLQQAHQAGKLLLAEEESETEYLDNGRTIVHHEDPALQTARQDLERIFAQGEVAAFIGHKYDVDRDGRIFAVDEGIRGLVQLEERAHTMLARMCALAVQAKIADVQIELAKTMGLMIQTVIIGVLRDKGIHIDQEVSTLVVKHMDAVQANQQRAIAA